MLLNALLQIGLFSAQASGGTSGHNFLVAFEDIDGAFTGQTPTLWVIVPGEPSLQFPLSDNGLDGDKLAGDGQFSGMVNELPPVEIHLSLQTADGEIWREPNFLFTADFDYPALRLRFEKGQVSGGLVSDLSPTELLERRSSYLRSLGKELPGWIKPLLAFAAGFLVLLVLRFSLFFFSALRRWRTVPVQIVRDHSWPLGQGLPVLHDGLQLWVFSGSTSDVRTRIQQGTQDLGVLFWFPTQGADDLFPDGIRVWSGTKPTGGELIDWRDAGVEPSQSGPLFIEGLQGLQRGELSDEECLFDLSEMAGCPVVLLIPQGEALPKGAVDLHQV